MPTLLTTKVQFCLAAAITLTVSAGDGSSFVAAITQLFAVKLPEEKSRTPEQASRPSPNTIMYACRLNFPVKNYSLKITGGYLYLNALILINSVPEEGAVNSKRSHYSISAFSSSDRTLSLIRSMQTVGYAPRYIPQRLIPNPKSLLRLAFL